MPRGKFTNHKGRNRKFTSPEELEEQRKQEEQKQRWRKEHGTEMPSEESSDEQSGSGSGDSDSDDDRPSKAKGVSGLIEVENPNRVMKKNKKLTSLDTFTAVEKPQLSRREREEIEKQRAAAAYQKLHAEGKTEQARADLARLAIIRQQREEAAKRREAEKKAKDEVPKKSVLPYKWGRKGRIPVLADGKTPAKRTSSKRNPRLDYSSGSESESESESETESESESKSDSDSNTDTDSDSGY